MYLLYRYIPKEIAYIKNMKLYFGPIFTQTLSKLVCAVSTWTSGGLIKLSLEHPESSLLSYLLDNRDILSVVFGDNKRNVERHGEFWIRRWQTRRGTTAGRSVVKTIALVLLKWAYLHTGKNLHEGCQPSSIWLCETFIANGNFIQSYIIFWMNCNLSKNPWKCEISLGLLMNINRPRCWHQHSCHTVNITQSDLSCGSGRSHHENLSRTSLAVGFLLPGIENYWRLFKRGSV